jgi:hypothetical protein
MKMDVVNILIRFTKTNTKKILHFEANVDMEMEKDISIS